MLISVMEEAVAILTCRCPVSDEMLMESMEMVVEDSEEPEDEDVGVLHLSPDGPPPLAALQSQQRPALLAGTEVGRLPPAEPMDQSAPGGSGGAAAAVAAASTSSGASGEQQYGPLALVACSGELVPHAGQQAAGTWQGAGGVWED